MAPKLSKSWTARGGFRQRFGLDRLRPDCKRVVPSRATKSVSRGKRGRPPKHVAASGERSVYQDRLKSKFLRNQISATDVLDDVAACWASGGDVQQSLLEAIARYLNTCF
eukprot:3168788-Amphidinium_carterae.1